MKSLSHVRLLAIPWTAAYQAPPSMGFSRQEYWSGVPLPSLIHVIYTCKYIYIHIHGDSVGKEFACNAGDLQCKRRKRYWFDHWVGKIPSSGKWQPTPFCLKNPMDRGAWKSRVHGVTESDTTDVTEHAHTIGIYNKT